MRLNWLGEVSHDTATKNTFKVVLALLLSYTVFSIALEIAEGSMNYMDIPAWSEYN